jgi:hypothetical protein
MILLRYIKPDACELEGRPFVLLSGSLSGDEGIEDIIVEDPVDF